MSGNGMLLLLAAVAVFVFGVWVGMEVQREVAHRDGARKASDATRREDEQLAMMRGEYLGD